MGFCPGAPLLTDIMKLLLVSCLAAVALAHNADYTQLQFAQFKEQFGKTYLSRAEHNLRFDIFKTNMKKIEEHNKSGASWKMAMNQFSDLTPHPWTAQLVLEDQAMMNNMCVDSVEY